MTTRRAGRLATVAIALVALPLMVGCGDDGTTGSGNGNPLVGTWNALSFELDGVDLIGELGVSVSITFDSSGGYSITVTGDRDGLLCQPGPNCSMPGTYSNTSSTVTFDQGTTDELTFNYTIVGDMLTLTGNGLSATLQRG